MIDDTEDTDTESSLHPAAEAAWQDLASKIGPSGRAHPASVVQSVKRGLEQQVLGQAVG
jgi:hypothetical protein